MNITTKRLQQEGTPKQPSPPRKKRKQLGQGTGDNNAPKKKHIRTKCSADGCTNVAKKGGVCVSHGAKRKTCSHEACTNIALTGEVCMRHGGTVKIKICRHEGCSNNAQNGGVCISHGAKQTRKICSHEGCTNIVQKTGICRTHGAKKKTCSHEGCNNQVQKSGVCIRHGAKKTTCRHVQLMLRRVDFATDIVIRSIVAKAMLFPIHQMNRRHQQ